MTLKLILAKAVLILLLAIVLTGCGLHRITSTPSGADIYYLCDNYLTDLSKNIPLSTNLEPAQKGYFYETKTPSYTTVSPFGCWYQVRKEGYENSQIIWLPMATTQKISHHFSLEKKKMEELFESITSDPTGAKIIWGEEKNKMIDSGHQTPYKSLIRDYDPVFAPKYIWVKLHGYKNSEIVFLPESKKDRTQHFVLRKAELKKVKETITSNPPGASIHSGENKENLIETGETTPYSKTFEDFSPSLPPLYIQVRKEGYHNSKIEFFGKTVHDRTIHYNLLKKQYGYVKLTANQGAVDIYVNGALTGQIRNQKPLNIKLPEGRYLIMARKDFFKPVTIPVSLKKKQVFSYHFDLVPAKGWQEDEPAKQDIIQAKGKLTIVTERNDLEVEIEGSKITPPFELKSIASGVYNIRILGPNINKKMIVTVEVDQEVFLDLDEIDLSH